jgi:hypothetical protein
VRRHEIVRIVRRNRPSLSFHTGSALVRTFGLLPLRANCGRSQALDNGSICPPRQAYKQKSPGSGAKGRMQSHLLPRQLRSSTYDITGERSPDDASAGTDRAGVHPSWHEIIEAAVTPAALQFTQDVPESGSYGVETQSARALPHLPRPCPPSHQLLFRHSKRISHAEMLRHRLAEPAIDPVTCG